ncbi:MAG: hypothetical protein KDK97_13300 [Verrucomicrobiales bacterium]|nr:hypothetical protein [Verrucomicrobiales bacterium]MCP5558950.1 hypothetical protein [Verrucomicrobiaceae bacterium]
MNHFFEGVEPLLTPPSVTTEIDGDTLKVTVRFAPNSGEESGHIWWMYDRAPDGSPKYLTELIPDANSSEMRHDAKLGVWTASLHLDAKATRIDFFTNHRKVVHYGGKAYATYLSCPYTRVSW